MGCIPCWTENSLRFCVRRRSSPFSHWWNKLSAQGSVAGNRKNGVLQPTPSATSRFQPREPSAAPQLHRKHQHFWTPCRPASAAHHDRTHHHFHKGQHPSSPLSMDKLHDLLPPSAHHLAIPSALRGSYDDRGRLQWRPPAFGGPQFAPTPKLTQQQQQPSGQ